jgi:SAM-dependent methyltransferase
MPIARELVELGYLRLLGRAPENDTIVSHWANHFGDLWEMIECFIDCAEFREKRSLNLRTVPIDVPSTPVDVEVDAPTLDALLAHVRKSWEHLGRQKAHFSVLTNPKFLPEALQDNEVEFWATGERDAAILERVLSRHEAGALEHKTCVDFGCGVGRVTAPLSKRFLSVHAYDISAPHLEIAKQHIGASRNVEFHLLQELPLRLAAANVFYSRIVLQHNPPPVIALLIRRGLECLKRGGLAVFQVPTYEIGYTFSAATYLENTCRAELDMEMHCIPQHHVFRIARETGCRVLEVREDGSTGRLRTGLSNLFVIQSP